MVLEIWYIVEKMGNQRTTKSPSEFLLMSRKGRKEKRQNHGGRLVYIGFVSKKYLSACRMQR